MLTVEFSRDELDRYAQLLDDEEKRGAMAERLMAAWNRGRAG